MADIIPTYDFAPQNNLNPINAPVIESSIGDGTIPVVADIRYRSQPNRVDVGQGLYSTNKSDSLWETSSNQKPSFEVWNTNLEDAYVKLNDGTYQARFENYMSGVDNEDRLARQQGTGEKLLNGVGKFIAKTGVNVLDGTVGTVNGVLQGIETGTFNAVYNNDFSKWVDDLNTKLDYKLPNYYSQQEKEGSIFSNLGTVNFWADKVLGGMSFVTGTLISEAIWAAATGGSSLATIGARATLAEGITLAAKNQNKIMHSVTSLMNAYQRTVPVAKSLKAFNNARFLLTSAGYESGVEARHYLKEAEANFLQHYSTQYGRRPTGEEMAAFKENSLNSANAVFGANLALVGGSNIAQFGNIFGLGVFNSSQGLQRSVSRALGVGTERVLEGAVDTYRALNPTRTQRILGTAFNVLKSPFREGVIEEGGQHVIGDFGQRWLASKFDPDAVQDNFSAVDAMGKSLAATYGTKEGLEDVVIGSLIGGLSGGGQGLLSRESSLAEGLGFTQFGKEVAQQQEIAKWQTANSNYNLLSKFTQAATQKASRGKIANAVDGVVANQEIQLAVFSKLQVDDQMGLLDDSSSNFTTALNELNDTELAQQLGVSVEEAQQAKIEAIDAHTTAVTDYKQAQRYAESVMPEGFKLEVDGSSSFIPSNDAQAMLALNIYMGKNSDRQARKYAQGVADTVGDEGVNSALAIENTLQDKQVNKSKEVKKLTKELDFLERNSGRGNDELLKIASQPRTEKGDSRLEAFETRRQEILAAQERDIKRRDAIRDELSGIATDLNNVRKARRIANQNFAGVFDDENLTADSLISATTSLQELSQTLSTWENSGQKAAAQDVAYMIDQFDKSQKAFQYANEVYTKLSDPALRTKEVKNIFGKFINSAKKQGADVSDYQKAQQELFNILKNQYQEFRTVLNSETFVNNTLTEQIAVTEEGDTLSEIPATSTQEDEIKADFQARRQEIENREDELETKEADLALLEQQEQETIEAVREESILNTPAPNTLRERLQNVVAQTLKNRRDIESISEPLKRPTEAQMEEYKTLYERNRKSRNGLKPTDQLRFEELKEIFNTYGRAVGTVEGGVRLSDILEQIANLDEIKNTQQESLPINNTNTEEIQAALTTASGRRDTFDKAQYWEKSEFRVLPTGNFSITGVNLQGFVDVISKDNQTTVLYDKVKGRKNNRKQVTGTLTGNDYQTGDKFIVKIGEEEIGVSIGETGGLEISPSAVEIVNTQTRFKLIPSTTLGTNYQPLLVELNRNAEVTPLEIVNTNYDTEPGLSFTDFTNKPDNSETALFVSTRNPYNQELLQQFREGKIKRQELNNKLAIYVMSQEGELGGILKALPKNISEDSNYEELAQIRNVATQRAIDSNLENDLIDTQITVPIDRGGSYFGKPNFNLLLNKTTNTLSVELISLSDKAMNKISDVGYITDGRLTLKDNVKEENKIDTTFVKRLSRGRKIPVIVFNYNGSRVAYPVSMNETQRDKAGEFQEILNADLPLNEKVNNLNNFLSENNIDSNSIENGFYYVAGETNVSDTEQVERIMQQLQNQSSYSDFTLWAEANNLEAAKQMVQQQASINIDITDKPFHSPKLALKLKDRTIIGGGNNPVIKIAEIINKNMPKRNIEQLQSEIINNFKKFAEETTENPEYKKAYFSEGEVTYVVTDRGDDFSGVGSSFTKTWNVAKYNQGTYAHVRILMDNIQKRRQTKSDTLYDNLFHESIKSLAKRVRTQDSVVIVDIRQNELSLSEEVSQEIENKTC